MAKWIALLAASLLVLACSASELMDTPALRAPSSGGCSNFVPNAGMQSSNPTQVLCGSDWLLQLLSRYNQTEFESYLTESNGNLVRVLDFACTLPGDGCKDCVEKFVSFYDKVATPKCSQFTTSISMALPSTKDAAYDIGRACRTTNNPFQVFHPLPAISSDCYVCARAFMNQYACANTECNDAYGLSWWPFYPLPPNSDMKDGVGVKAADWGPEVVCSCFNRQYKTPLSKADLDEFGHCLWVVYQGNPPFPTDTPEGDDD